MDLLVAMFAQRNDVFPAVSATVLNVQNVVPVRPPAFANEARGVIREVDQSEREMLAHRLSALVRFHPCAFDLNRAHGTKKLYFSIRACTIDRSPKHI